MNWSEQHLGQVWSLMDRAANFLLLDAVEQNPIAYLVAARRWATGGFRIRELGVAARVKLPLPAVMIHRRGDLTAANLAMEWMASKGADAFKVVQMDG